MRILIENVLLNGETQDIFIDGNLIRAVGKSLPFPADIRIEGKGKAAIPGLVNAHTHAAMTLFRGFADDMPLENWLNEKIWPNEDKLKPEDIYWGTKLACLEMIKSGTTAFFDMYDGLEATAEAVAESGMRAVLSSVCFDDFDPGRTQEAKERLTRIMETPNPCADRMQYALGPHAIYSVSGAALQWIDGFSRENDLLIHLHIAETVTEVENSVGSFGLTPVRYLHRLGVLSPRLVLAHCLWVDEEEIKMLADHGVSVVHNPASNMKLASGYRFRYDAMQAAGITVGLGTDGCASSNNLDMIEAMKQASLLGKAWKEDPEYLPAGEVYKMATLGGSRIIRSNAGIISPGYPADLCLVDLHRPAFTPNFNFVSNLVYAANGSCVDTVICNGKILMQNGKVDGEDEILERAAAVAYDLVKRKR